MKKIFPKVYNDQLLICVGENEKQIEYIVGESVLNQDSEREKCIWKKAIRVAMLDEIEKVLQCFRAEDYSKAYDLAKEIIETITAYDDHWFEKINELKALVEDENVKR